MLINAICLIPCSTDVHSLDIEPGIRYMDSGICRLTHISEPNFGVISISVNLFSNKQKVPFFLQY
jgi:hypothetical protein